MSLFRNMFGIGGQTATASPTATAPSGAPVAAPAAVPVGETESVRRIAARLNTLPPARARFVAAFAYLLARAADSDMAVSSAENAEMARLIEEESGLDAATASIVVELADTRVEDFGATDDYLVTREFKAISTPEERERLLRCCLLVAAADDDIDANESWLVNRIAEELDVRREDLNRIRDEFTDKIGALQDLRRMREQAAADAASTAGATTTVAASAGIAVAAVATSDVPAGVKIEQVFLVEVPYTPEAQQLRPALRPQHLERILRLKLQDRVIEAGGTTDFDKAVLLIRASSEDEVRQLIADDVYTSGGVWQEPKIVGYGRVVPG
jgi:uncharacterized tellurite resistance protein B-like protein/uncharacterized protein YciI